MITEDRSTNSILKKVPDWVFAVIPIVATFLVWIGTTRSGFTPDDYFVVDIQSPIRTFIDVISMFWRHDPNPQYWRPLADSSVSFDFWLWGWNGGMFHLTNLLLHCIAVGLIYLFVRKIFSFSAFSASVLALLFGVSGSHDSNLLWIAARADVLATIMMLLVLLTAYRATRASARKWVWLTASFICYFFALSAKEVSGVVIVLLPLLIYTSSLKELWQRKWQVLKKLLPYIAVTALFLFIRLQFTVPLDQMQPLTAEGSHSIAAFSKNFLYSIGYIIAPIDFRLASFIINRYATIGYAAAILFFIGLILLIKISGGKDVWRSIYKPLLLTLVTGLVSFQSFERWRVYLPSVGVLAILIILFSLLWKNKAQTILRPMLIVLAISFAGFHIRQSIEAYSIWARSTAQLQGFEQDMEKILAGHSQRPITLELVTSPTKLGSASLLQLSKLFLAKKAEADLAHLPSLGYGVVSIPGDTIWVETDVDLYALDPDKGFRSVVFKKIGSNDYEISADKDEIGLFPNAAFEGGKARRDLNLFPGKTYETYGALVTIENAEASFASKVKLHLRDSSAVHLYFNGEHIIELP